LVSAQVAVFERENGQEQKFGSSLKQMTLNVQALDKQIVTIEQQLRSALEMMKSRVNGAVA